MKRVIISPHFDDEILGVGGTMNKYSTDDWTLVYVTSANEERIQERDRMLSHLKSKVQKIKIVDLNFKDSGSGIGEFDLDSTNLSKLAKLIEKHCEAAEIVYIPFKSLHQDHQVINHACLIALRSFQGTILEYEYTDQFSQFNTMTANYFERLDDISIRNKVYQMRAYFSQVNNLRDEEAIVSLAKIRGYQCGFPYAEGFNLIRHINN